MTVDEKGNIHLPSLAAVNFCPHSRLEDMMQTTFTLVVNNAVVRLLIFKNLLAQHVHRLSPVGAGPFPTSGDTCSLKKWSVHPCVSCKLIRQHIVVYIVVFCNRLLFKLSGQLTKFHIVSVHRIQCDFQIVWIRTVSSNPHRQGVFISCEILSSCHHSEMVSTQLF